MRVTSDISAPGNKQAVPPSHRTFFCAALLLLPAILSCPVARAQKPLIVIGFMGGNVRGNNFVHREALLAKNLQARYPLSVRAEVFANHDWKLALDTILHLLDENKDGSLSPTEKSAARIVIYGHSWGASETVTLAKRLNDLSIPVLLTVQVDSVEKMSERDEAIPPNVHEAINFYQTEGFLHGRRTISAMNPKETSILGNYRSTYRKNPIACTEYPWFARTFMKSHIEIENDPAVWDRIEALIGTKVLNGKPAQMGDDLPVVHAQLQTLP